MIRNAINADFDRLGEIMYLAIRTGQSPYTEAQRKAWISEPHLGKKWSEKLGSQYVVLAEKAGQIVGFMTLRSDGYLDLAFILPEARGKGLFRRLYDRIEGHADSLGLVRLWTHASLMAQPAFAAVGFCVVKHEVISREGECLARAEMDKAVQR